MGDKSCLFNLEANGLQDLISEARPMSTLVLVRFVTLRRPPIMPRELWKSHIVSYSLEPMIFY